MKISERIKKYREENHITQQELADKLYVSKQAISKWENDKSLPDVSMYPTIASLLNITVDELMGNEANNYRQMLCETSNKLSSVEIKNYNFSDHVINTFVAPELNIDVISEKRQNVRIAYDVKKDIANYVKDYLNVKSYKDVGDYTFNYYVKMEGIRNEESENSEL